MIEAITDGVKDGRYAPGQRLVEADLTAELGVSRGPLREALGRLAAEGVLELEPYRGAVVRRLTREDVEDLFSVREVLEGEAARLAASTWTTTTTGHASRPRCGPQTPCARPATSRPTSTRTHASTS